MKHALKLLVIISVVMTLMVMTVSIASAHDVSGKHTQSADGLNNNNKSDGPGGGSNQNGFDQQVPHNPTCGGHNADNENAEHPGGSDHANFPKE